MAALGWLRRRRRPAITGLYCSDIGVPISNAQMHAVNAEAFLDDCTEKSRSLYDKLLLRNPERVRHLVRPYREIVACTDPAERARFFQENALALMTDAAEGALARGEIKADQIDILIVNYMAGKSLPSLTSLVHGALEMPSTVLTVNMSDMGCSAAVAALDVAVRMLQSEGRPARALVLSLEPVSNLFQLTDSPGAIVGNTLFGEGCAGVVLSTHREAALYHIGPRQRIHATDPDSLDAIKLAHNEHGPMIQLSKGIPEVAGKAIEKALRRLVPRIISPWDKIKYLLTRKTPKWQRRVDRWAIHPGGTAVLDGLQKQLRLAEADLGPSYRVFDERSNMSSPAVVYALDNIEKTGPRKGESILMMSFGSGFKVNAMMLTKGSKRLYETPEKSAVVIGGTSGIGLDAARQLQSEGYQVFIGSRRAEDPDARFERVPGATYLKLDVTCPDSVGEFVRKVWTRSYGIDLLVVSSGIANPSQMQGRSDPGMIQRTVLTNLTGAMLVVNQCLPKMRVRGQVVMLNSILGQIPLQGNAVYCATKAGLKHFAASVEVELRRAGRGVRIHNLYPAYVRTPMLEEVAGKGKTFLAPIPPELVTAAIQRAADGQKPARAGFMLWRDRAIAALYWWMPSTFKRIIAAM